MLFRINKRDVKREVDRLGANKKTLKGLTVSPVANAYKQAVWNLTDTLQDADAYSLAQWLVHVERWIDDRGKNITATYNRGEILFVEFGAMNYGYEPSYEHPAIVLANAFNTILVAPCSSQTFGKGHRNVIDITVTEATGLTNNTGIGIGGARWISKNRVLNRAGKVTNPVILDKLDEFLLNNLHFYQVVLAHHENEVYNLNREKKVVEDELETMKELLISVEDLISRFSPELLQQFKAIAASAKEKSEKNN
ncbi:type II toxin-antitoxin system PemK/MazF family toxin [Cohnella sp. AR92]|uniref:type II toxin-antitoxin system PemK/MazF family toxin n=1 Tax=Cohnella sp. AR92 TaxID=648716 RepID=UPI0013150BC6|nr:type II toxin-antitoxin system PemK/MazF family toxin [Cohnella sp. AR92]